MSYDDYKVDQQYIMGVLELLRRIKKFCTYRLSLSQITTKMKLILAFGALLIIKFYLRRKPATQLIKTVPISQFLSQLNKNALEKVKISPGEVYGLDKFSNVTKSNYGMPSQILYNELKNTGVKIEYATRSSDSSTLDFLLFFVSICSSLLIYYLYKKDSYDKRPSRPEQKVRFQDIVGLDSAKFALKQVLDFMMNPEKYKQRGARMRRGVLLYGPPGTGKTTLAKACANEAGIPFYSCNAAQFCQIYVGMGPKKVRELFAKAKQTSPSVIFIDELDALGSRSSQNNFMMESANSEKNSTINQILSELDGFETSDQVLVIAATNRLEMVDRSLVRSGRFDLKIEVSLPSLQTKIKIFHKYASKTKNELSEAFILKLLQSSKFCSGADIEALVNEAIYLSMRRNSNKVEEDDIMNAIKQQSSR